MAWGESCVEHCQRRHGNEPHQLYNCVRENCADDVSGQFPVEHATKYTSSPTTDINYRGCLAVFCSDVKTRDDYTACALTECSWLLPTFRDDEDEESDALQESDNPVRNTKRLTATAESLARIIRHANTKRDNQYELDDLNSRFSSLHEEDPTTPTAGLHAPKKGYGIGYDNECIETMCSSLSGNVGLKCIKKCIRLQHDNMQSQMRPQEPNNIRPKRIINDETSQCIQSYCGGKQNRERLRCIVLSCHRA